MMKRSYQWRGTTHLDSPRPSQYATTLNSHKPTSNLHSYMDISKKKFGCFHPPASASTARFSSSKRHYMVSSKLQTNGMTSYHAYLLRKGLCQHISPQTSSSLSQRN